MMMIMMMIMMVIEWFADVITTRAQKLYIAGCIYQGHVFGVYSVPAFFDFRCIPLSHPNFSNFHLSDFLNGYTWVSRFSGEAHLPD